MADSTSRIPCKSGPDCPHRAEPELVLECSGYCFDCAEELACLLVEADFPSRSAWHSCALLDDGGSSCLAGFVLSRVEEDGIPAGAHPVAILGRSRPFALERGYCCPFGSPYGFAELWDAPTPSSWYLWPNEPDDDNSSEARALGALVAEGVLR